MPSRLADAHDQHVSQYAQNAGYARQMGERGAIFGRRPRHRVSRRGFHFHSLDQR